MSYASDSITPAEEKKRGEDGAGSSAQKEKRKSVGEVSDDVSDDDKAEVKPNVLSRNDSKGVKVLPVKKPVTKRNEEEEEEQEEEEEVEITEFQMKVVQQIRALQGELKKKIESEKEKDELIATLRAQLGNSGSASSTGNKFEDQSEDLALQVEQLTKENAVLRNKIKKMRRDVAGKSEGDLTVENVGSAEELATQLAESKLEYMKLSYQHDTAMQFLFAKDADSEEGFKPKFDHGVRFVGWAMKESDLFKKWRRRMCVMRSDGVLTWYTAAERPKSKGDMNVKSLTRIVVGSSDVPCQVTLVNNDRSMRLWFADNSEMEGWMDSMKKFVPNATILMDHRNNKLEYKKTPNGMWVLERIRKGKMVA